jgi:hypothetical protein
MRTLCLICNQVIHVQRLAAPQNRLQPEARDTDNRALMLKKCELIPLGLLYLDASNELLCNQHGTKLMHHRKTTIDLGGSPRNLDG